METPRRAEARWNEKNAVWRIDVQANGQRKTFRSKTPGKRGKTECERAADEWIAGGSNCLRNGGRTVFADAWDEYRKSMARAVSTGQNATIECYGRRYFLPMFGRRAIGSITRRDWQDCINSIHEERGLSKKTLENIRGIIVSFCHYLLDSETITADKVPLGLKIPRGAAVGEKKALQPDAVRDIFTRSTYTSRNRQKECFEIHTIRWAIASGMRPGEIIGLQWADITADTKTIRRSINVLGEHTQGKNRNALRTSLLTGLERQVLADQREHLRKHGIISPWVFPNKRGEALTQKQLYKAWLRMQKDMPGGEQYSLYELRHTMISIAKSVPKTLLEPVVGHSATMDTFGIYAHAIEGDAQRAADLIDKAFADVIGK